MDMDTRLTLSVLRDTVKSLKDSIDRVANSLEKANELKESELKLMCMNRTEVEFPKGKRYV